MASAPDSEALIRARRSHVAAQDNAGRHVARALHEGIGQSLTGVALQLQALAGDLRAAPGLEEQAGMAATLVEQLAEALEQVRALARTSNPDRVSAASLADALHDLQRVLPSHRRKELSIDATAPVPAWLSQREAGELARVVFHAMRLIDAPSGKRALHVAVSNEDDALGISISGPGVEMAQRGDAIGGFEWELLQERSALAGVHVAVAASQISFLLPCPE